jgi:hypothetical protein
MQGGRFLVLVGIALPSDSVIADRNCSRVIDRRTSINLRNTECLNRKESSSQDDARIYWANCSK